MFVFLNGKILAEGDAHISIFDRGFLYGDGLFETINISNELPFRWSAHWNRLEQGASFLKISLPFSSEDALDFVDQLISRNKMRNGILRINCSRGIGLRGYSIRGANSPTFLMTLHDLPIHPEEILQRWKLVTSSFRVAQTDPLTGMKTSNKLLQIFARNEAEESGADEALLLNSAEEIAETSSGNFFWIEENEVFTPPISTGILPGVTRQIIFEIAASLNFKVQEQCASIDKILNGNGAFITMSSLGIVEVTGINNTALSCSPMTKKIAEAYRELVKTETSGS